jgi:hypothetical protein
MKTDLFNKFLTFLNKLEQQKIHYQVSHHRDEAVMITVSIAGQRWEIEFLDNGDIEVEKFISNGEISGEETLKELFERETTDKFVLNEMSILT